jgi:hypothetical protein
VFTTEAQSSRKGFLTTGAQRTQLQPNPKHEIRNPKQIQMTQIQIT